EIFIQIGNSADPTNNHFELIDKIYASGLENIKVFCPLSYGNMKYRNMVLKYGDEWLGKKFVPMLDFMEFEKYNLYMSSIDVAVFNYNRQKAMRNIIGLLRLGKEVVISSSPSYYCYFKELGLSIFSTECIESTSIPLTEEEKIKNIKIMHDNFNENKL